MFCVRCGAGAKANEKICAQCGMRLIAPDALLKLMKLSQADKAQKRADAKEKAASKKEAGGIKSAIFPKPLSIFDDYEESAPQKRASRKPVSEKTQAGKAAPKKKAEKPNEKAVVKNPVVKLPPKKTEAKAERKGPKAGYSKEMFLIPERREKSGGKAGGREGMRRASTRTPVRKESGKASSRAKAAEDGKRHKASSKKASASAKKKEAFADRHMRSAVSMCLLVFTVIMVLVWGYGTKSGLKTFAQYGVGTVKGYILLGDEFMDGGNYNRAVEYYYKALRDDVTYEAAYKLSAAYRKTGDIENETSALLLLMDHYAGEEAPYKRILELYPDPATRPERVQMAISMHENIR